MNNHIMLDLETLGTGRNSVILSIGAVRFDPFIPRTAQAFDGTFYAEFGSDSLVLQQRLGLEINAATVEWWMRQSVLAKRVFKNGVVDDPADALLRFTEFVNYTPRTKIWGNGSDFDNLLLGDMYDALSIKRPWSYSNNRCYRTMKNLPGGPSPSADGGVAHHALDDALRQAKHLVDIYQWLGMKTDTYDQ